MSDMDIVMEGSGLEEGDEIEYVQPVALLMDELKSEDSAVRVESMRRLRTIALALGPERTRSELLPFLQTCLDDEDEVLAALADEAALLLEHLGGQEHLLELLPLFEGLVSAEEPIVRGRALTGLASILGVLEVEQLSQRVVPMVQKLVEGDWFSKKTSAAAILVELIGRLVSDEGVAEERRELVEELVGTFGTLAVDDSPLVRKATATSVVKVIEQIGEPLLSGSIASICVQLAGDPQDSVRLLAVEPLALLMNRTTEDAALELLLPTFLSLAGDSSWRIRFMVATHFGSFVQVLNGRPSVADKVDMLGIFCALLRDAESEVRGAACTQLARTAAVLGDLDRDDMIISSIRLLLTDPSPHVRASLALQLSDLSHVYGAERAASVILPMVLQQLRDDSSEVRLNVISKLDVIVDVIGIDQLAASLLPAVINLAEDRQWRVRQTIIAYIPELAAHLGAKFFEEKLANLVFSWLGDSVFAVRETAIDSVKRLVRQFGSEWAVASGFLANLLELASHRNYLRRQTILFAMAALCSVVPTGVILDLFLPCLERLAGDPIPNVRFNVAKTLEAIVPVLLAAMTATTAMTAGAMAPPLASQVIRDQILPTLQQLQRDADVDVHDFATRALNIIPAF